MSIFFTRIIPRKALWGGSTLRRAFGFPDNFGDNVGQAWAFSAQEDQPSIIESGTYAGKSLLDLWQEHPEFFNSCYQKFPFIISIVAPEADLSIQVHPGDKQARQLGYPYGKNEAWVFLKTEPSSAIIYGHTAKDEADLRRYISQGDWDSLVRHVPVKAGDCIYIPAGVLHALCQNTLVYEIQQSTDITYRFYDYGRKDAQGNLRPLQLENAIDCLLYDDMSNQSYSIPRVTYHPNFIETLFISNSSFVVRQFNCTGPCTLQYPGYLLCTIVEGTGFAQGFSIKKGDSFLLPANEELQLDGTFTMLTTSEK